MGLLNSSSDFFLMYLNTFTVSVNETSVTLGSWGKPSASKWWKMNLLMAGPCSVNIGNRSLVMKGCMGRGLAKWVLCSGWVGVAGWVGSAEQWLMKRIRWWLGKCLVFTANCRNLEGLDNLGYLCLMDMWKACVRSGCSLSLLSFMLVYHLAPWWVCFPFLPSFSPSLWEGEMSLQNHPSLLPSKLISSCHKWFSMGREIRAPGSAHTKDNNRG